MDSFLHDMKCCNVGIPDILRVNCKCMTKYDYRFYRYSIPEVGIAYPWHAEVRGKVADV